MKHTLHALMPLPPLPVLLVVGIEPTDSFAIYGKCHCMLRTAHLLDQEHT
jgi:hypothetical protein